MGTCRTCAYSWKDDWGDLYCSLMVSKSGRYKKVSASASCDNYAEMPTKSNSNYTGGGCFLTSACVDHLGKADDCYELTTLRTFRDTYLASLPDGEMMIKEYYEVAPKIVEAIDRSANKQEYYSYIYGEIQSCIEYIEQGKDQEALNGYKNMVEKLKKETLG